MPITGILPSLLELFLPQYCCGCMQRLSPGEHILCLRCLSELPETHFHLYSDNPVARKLTGRVSFENATASYYFHKSSIVQNIIHHFKYKGKEKAAFFMGKLMGKMLQTSTGFGSIDGIVPVPLHPKKLKKRGYNQSRILGNGISEVLKKPVLPHVLKRRKFTQTQTRLSVTDRWQNVKSAFAPATENIPDLHLLLVDDVITSGATLEACAAVLKNMAKVKISIAALAIAEGR